MDGTEQTQPLPSESELEAAKQAAIEALIGWLQLAERAGYSQGQMAGEFMAAFSAAGEQAQQAAVA